MPQKIGPIVNKVANSALVVFNLENYYLKGLRRNLDISQWLEDGFILKEKNFREQLAHHLWEDYKEQYVAVSCSTGAIIPNWAYILVSAYLNPLAKSVIVGNLEALETSLYQTSLQNIDFAAFKDKAIILKGCSQKPVPQNAYLFALKELQKVAKSVMFGEACSAVPLFKRKK